MRLVRHMQAGNRPGTAETRGFLTGESSPFVMDLVQTFMADACFRPHAESNQQIFKDSHQMFCLRKSLFFDFYVKGDIFIIFYIFSTYFLLLTWDFSYIFSQTRCCAVAHFKSQPPGQLACVQQPPWCDLNGYEWW